MYSFALDLYNENFGYVEKMDSIKPLDSMSFYYYMGFIYVALKKYEKAREAFRYVLIHPTKAIHKCILNAYKKYIIVSLLTRELPELPTKACNKVKKYLPTFSSEYIAISEAMLIVHYI